MKIYLTVFLVLLSLTTWSQQSTTDSGTHTRLSEYRYHSIMATASLGFIDFYRSYYSVPKGFAKGNTSGFVPIYAKLECGLYRNISLAATFCYDNFVYNYNQEYIGNNGPFSRYRTSNTRVISGGVTAFYHLGNVIHLRHLDPFIGVGVSLNNIRYGSYPQGDSSVIKLDHTVTPYLKAGARYYLSSKYSLFADLGYDQQSIFGLGATCRFSSKKK